MAKANKIKKIIRESKFTKQQLSIWRKLNIERLDRNICSGCFDRMIEMLEELKENKDDN